MVATAALPSGDSLVLSLVLLIFPRPDSHLGFTGLLPVKAFMFCLVCFSDRFPGLSLGFGDLSLLAGLFASFCFAWSLSGSVYVFVSHYRLGFSRLGFVRSLFLLLRYVQDLLFLGFFAGVVNIWFFPPSLEVWLKYLIVLPSYRSLKPYPISVEVELIHYRMLCFCFYPCACDVVQICLLSLIA